MSNPLINNQQKEQKQPDYKALFENFSQNPVENLVKMKFNIPSEVGNDPAKIGQYLLSTGQINQQMIGRVMPMLNPFLAWISRK